MTALIALVGPKYNRPLATRNGLPAWVNAPPRLRASDLRKEPRHD